MTQIVIVMLAFIVLILLIMWGSNWFMGFVMKALVGNKHHVLEEVTSTGNVPVIWSSPYDKKIQRYKDNGLSEDRVSKLQQEAQLSYLRKLDQLIVYVKKTNLVEDEETREVLLADLLVIRSKWEAGN